MAGNKRLVVQRSQRGKREGTGKSLREWLLYREGRGEESVPEGGGCAAAAGSQWQRQLRLENWRRVAHRRRPA